ncbi:type II secretion system protein [bacterium]|nr:type II secretion system protein [candidate division CSSED10-310 bacterium]
MMPLLHSNQSMIRKRRFQSAAGMTLLEVMIALCIMSILMLTCYSAMHGALRAAARARDAHRALSFALGAFADAELKDPAPGLREGVIDGPGGPLNWSCTTESDHASGLVKMGILIVRADAPEDVVFSAEKLIARASER